jgi:hypothetical protein
MPGGEQAGKPFVATSRRDGIRLAEGAGAPPFNAALKNQKALKIVV